MRVIKVASAESYVDKLFSVLSICDLYAYIKAKEGFVTEPSKYAGMRVEQAQELLPKKGRRIRVVGEDFEYILVVKDVFRVRVRRENFSI